MDLVCKPRVRAEYPFLDKVFLVVRGVAYKIWAKTQAEILARPIAAGQVVALEIAVIPVGVEKEAKAINTDLDKGIEKNLDAALIAGKLHDSVKYEVKNAVVTLTGEVISQERRAFAEKVAIGVPYVKQVVNTVQVKDQKATSTKY